MEAKPVKTIFITSFHGYVSRNLLATDALGELAAKDGIRTVIFVPLEKREFFENNFASPRVVIEPVSFAAPSSLRLSSLLMKRIAKYGLNSFSTRIERKGKLRLEQRRLYFIATSAASFFLSRLRILRRLMRWTDYRLAVKDRYRPYFEKYRPSLVFAADIQNERDVELLHNARYLGVPTAAMVRSWDNLTLHGLLRFIPDMLLVTAPRGAEQAQALNDVEKDCIRITGVPHYDKYLRPPGLDKEDFFRELGLDPSRKTVLFAPISDYYLRDNDADPLVFRILGESPYQVLVRFSPSLEVKSLDEVKPYPNMAIDRPGVRFAKGGRELSLADDDRLMHSLRWADVLVCGPSTLALDAMVFDRPVILVNFHSRPKSYLEGISRRYDYDHFSFALAAGACRLANNQEELLSLIEGYLKDPSLDKEGRERLREAFVGSDDGKSGRRVASAFLEMLGESV